MKRQSDEFIIFHGEIINKKEMEKFTFPVGCKFLYKNVSYNDKFIVASIKKEPGAEFRQIIGSVAGEVWILLSSLQREAAVGAITNIETNKASDVAETSPKKKVISKKKTSPKKKVNKKDSIKKKVKGKKK